MRRLRTSVTGLRRLKLRLGSSVSHKPPVVVPPPPESPIYRLATRQYGIGYNAETVVLTGDGTAKTYSVTLVNESGRALDTLAITFQGWGLTTTGTPAAGNDFTNSGNIEYPVGGTQTPMPDVVVPGIVGGPVKSVDITMPTSIPAGASFKLNFTSTIANGAKYISRLGFAGVVTKAKASELRKEAVMGCGDSLATNNGAALMNASAGKCPVYHASIVGTTVQTYAANGGANFVRQIALAKMLGITRIICNWSTNDLTAGRTPTQILADLQVLRAMANAEGIKFTQITMLPRVSKKAAIAVGPVTSAGNVMTMTVPDASIFVVNQAYTIAGATQTEYNGSFICRSIDTGTNKITFPFVGSATPTATGSITITSRAFTSSVYWQQPNPGYEPGPNSSRGQFNAAIRAGAFDGYIDWADAVEPYRDSGRFAVAGEKAALPLPVVATVLNASPRTTSRFITDYAVGSNTMANGVAQFISGTNIGVLKGGSNNTNGDFTAATAWTNIPAVNDQLVMWPGNSYAGDDGTHLRVATGGLGGQVMIDQPTGAAIDSWLAAA